MFSITCSETIRAARDEVFALAGDYANDPLWRTGVVSMRYEPGGPPAVGTRTREVMRMMGRNAETVGEIVAYSPARTAFRSVSGPVSCDGIRDFARTTNGTTFTYTLTLYPTGAMRLVAPVLRWMLQRQVCRDVRRLKRQLEQ